jgi:hypothetical protein
VGAEMLHDRSTTFLGNLHRGDRRFLDDRSGQRGSASPPNVPARSIALPHEASSTYEALHRIGRIAAFPQSHLNH